jgi:hypothetical protein
MKTSEIKRPLIEAKEVLAAGGALAAAKDIDALLTLVDDHADMDFDQFLVKVKHKLDPAALRAPLRSAYVKMLQDAKLDEVLFTTVLSKLTSDEQLDKTDILAIAKDYGVIRITGKSKAAYLDSIERYFHWMLYNEDANDMARRATPW